MSNKEPLVIAEQGSFICGGVTLKSEGDYDPYHPDPTYFAVPNPFTNDVTPASGQTYRADHAYVQYQKPVDPHRLPFVLLHGGFQSGCCWETTPDGREGFRDMLLRDKWSVYIPDQPRRGRAGRPGKPGFCTVNYEDETTFNCFRIGRWPDYYPGVAFSHDPEALNHFLRQVTPNTADCELPVICDAIEAIFDKIGDGILITHSQSGGFGWEIGMKRPEKVKAIISFEPGSNFCFPDDEPIPETLQCIMPWDPLPARAVSAEDFNKLLDIPILIYYGDNIAEEENSTKDWGQDHWRTRLWMARKWVNKINERGGNATLIELPKIGITGNTHFIFSDTNNVEVYANMMNWVHEQGLDK